ncbi:MAG: sec-independent protein translocase protein TatB [Porticoccus sp.]|jgi:sec-independent protein translocase protein TatB
MFDISFMELLLIAVITLIVMGPQRLPQIVRTITLWFGRARQAFSAVRKELENEVGMDEIRSQLHNEQIMRDLKSTKSELEGVMPPPISMPEITDITRADTSSSDTAKGGVNNTSNNKPDSDDSQA